MNNYRRLPTKKPINYSKIFTVLGFCFCGFSIVPMYFSIELKEIFHAFIFSGMFASGGIMIAYATIFKGDI